MAWYADHADCEYFRTWHPSLLRAVGWLERGKPYTQGTVEPQIFNALTELLKDPWEPGLFMGFHEWTYVRATVSMGKETCSFQAMASSLSVPN